jgi:hypothetical protein
MEQLTFRRTLTSNHPELNSGVERVERVESGSKAGGKVEGHLFCGTSRCKTLSRNVVFVESVSTRTT